MKLSQKKLVKRLLLATVAATSLVYFGGVCNIVHAADGEYYTTSSKGYLGSKIISQATGRDLAGKDMIIGWSGNNSYPSTIPNGNETSSQNYNNNSNILNNDGNDYYSRTYLQEEEISASTIVPTIQLVGFMQDKLVDWLPPINFDFDDSTDDSSDDTSNTGNDNSNVFIGAGGGSFRNKTGNGSFIDSTFKGFDVGFGRSLEYASGSLVFAPIFEYATGDYDSYLDDGMHGRGNTKYIAGGFIGRKTFKSGLYIEASARGGKTERDFSSDTMTSNGNPIFVHYDKKSAPIFAGHLRIGKQLRMNKNNLLDMYGIYFHAHQGSMDLNLSTGEDYHFNGATSARTRLGYRLTTRTSKISRIYSGLAFQYEHASSGNHGASGMLELGWLIKPNKTNSWMLDLNATGFVGHQKGVSATLKLQKEF